MAEQKGGRCACIAYESSTEDEDGPCHCGHAPEDHDRDGCHGDPTDNNRGMRKRGQRG